MEGRSDSTEPYLVRLRALRLRLWMIRSPLIKGGEDVIDGASDGVGDGGRTQVSHCFSYEAGGLGGGEWRLSAAAIDRRSRPLIRRGLCLLHR